MRNATPKGQEAETEVADQGQGLRQSSLDLHAQEEAKDLLGANTGSKCQLGPPHSELQASLGLKFHDVPWEKSPDSKRVTPYPSTSTPGYILEGVFTRATGDGSFY